MNEPGRLPPFLRSRAPIIGLALGTAALFAFGFIPLFDGPGYEISLVSGLILPACAAIATALELSRNNFSRRPSGAAEASPGESEAPRPPEPLDMLFRGLANGAALGLAGYLTTLVHGARSGFCDAWTGTQNFVLGPWIGAVLGGAWGAVAAEIAARPATLRRRRVVAVLAALAGPLTGVVVSLYRFFSSPMVFAYDPFVGFFSGTIYDTVIEAAGLLSYRAGSAATLGAAIVLALHLRRNERGGLSLRWTGRPGVALAGALCAVASIVHMASGTRLGHYQTPASIAHALGARSEGNRCIVLYPRGFREDDAARFTRDCDAHVRALERWFEVKGPDRITAYLFANVAQKASLMGAADTQIAKPWRHEIYVQGGAYPHPALGHELAHVLAGVFAHGPFKTGGSLGGWLPNPGLIEGVAVAASPPTGDLSPAEWAKAMKDLKLLPRLADLFALGFLGQNGAVAYTVSGAFVGFVKDTYGAEVMRTWYGGKSLPELTGKPWSELEASFHASLDALALSDAARAQAKARFDRPGIFGRRCPHVVDACTRKADSLRGSGDQDGALEQYLIVRSLDPNDAMVRVSMARTRVQKGDVEAGKADLRAIAGDEKVPRHVRDRALEDLADLALAPGGDGAFAAASYRELMTRTVDEDTLRTLEVKVFAAETPRARAAVYMFLVGKPGRGTDHVRAADLMGVWSREAPDDGLPYYLLGRQLHATGQFAEAQEKLALASAKRLPTARVEVEALRLRIVGACAQRDPIAARTSYDAYRARPEVPKARGEAMAGFVARCSEETGAIPAGP